MSLKDRIDLDQVNQNRTGLVKNLGIEFTAVTEGSLTARMPVDDRTKQPLGLLHGGATAALAETLGSMASFFLIDSDKFAPVGMEVSAQHIRSATSGFVIGKASAINIGRKVHIWSIRVTDEQEKLIAICKLTVMIIDRK